MTTRTPAGASLPCRSLVQPVLVFEAGAASSAPLRRAARAAADGVRPRAQVATRDGSWPMPDWSDVVAAGRALPEVEEGTWFRTPCLRVRKKSFCRMKEDGETLVVRVVDLEDKDALLRGAARRLLHHAALRRLRLRARAARRRRPRQLGELIEDAWRSCAPKRLVAAYDAERVDAVTLHHVDDRRAVGARTPPRARRGSPSRVVRAHAVAVERAAERGEVEAREVDAERRVAAVAHLVADLAVAAVVDDDHRQRRGRSCAAAASSVTLNSTPPSPASAATRRVRAAELRADRGGHRVAERAVARREQERARALGRQRRRRRRSS